MPTAAPQKAPVFLVQRLFLNMFAGRSKSRRAILSPVYAIAQPLLPALTGPRVKGSAEEQILGALDGVFVPEPFGALRVDKVLRFADDLSHASADVRGAWVFVA